MRYKNKRNKYNNHRPVIDGIKFHSDKEGARYIELKLLEKAGMIKDLKLQVPFKLIPTLKTSKETLRAVKYIADFVYYQNGQMIVEDVKGYKTKEYIIKKKLMYERYGIEIEEV